MLTRQVKDGTVEFAGQVWQVESPVLPPAGSPVSFAPPAPGATEIRAFYRGRPIWLRRTRLSQARRVELLTRLADATGALQSFAPQHADELRAVLCSLMEEWRV